MIANILRLSETSFTGLAVPQFSRAIGKYRRDNRGGRGPKFRAGTDFNRVAAERKRMSNEARKASETAKETLQRVKERANQVEDKMKKGADALFDAFDVADEYAEGMLRLGAEFRGILGMETNGPPSDDKQEK